MWEALELMDLASMIPRTTRTGDAEHTPLLPTLLTVVTGVHTQITTSSAPPVVVLSLWTVLDLGELMDLAITLFRLIKIRGVDSINTAPMLLTTVMAVHLRMTTSSALLEAVLSQ